MHTSKLTAHGRKRKFRMDTQSGSQNESIRVHIIAEKVTEVKGYTRLIMHARPKTRGDKNVTINLEVSLV